MQREEVGAQPLRSEESIVGRHVLYPPRLCRFWPAINHTVRTRAIITAVNSPGSKYFGDNMTAAEALSLLDWWLVKDLQSSNWWYNRESCTKLRSSCSCAVL